jgi:hypothetical protein
MTDAAERNGTGAPQLGQGAENSNVELDINPSAQ